MRATPRLPADTSSEELIKTLDHAGCLVVTGMTELDARRAVEKDLAPHMEAVRYKTEDDPTKFYPANSRRITGLVTRSETVCDWILHPTAREVSEHFLGPNCDHIQLHVTAAVEVGPGARAQVLHREEDLFPFFTVPRPNLIVATMWAMTDFRADNGGTLLVPGSHRWPAERKAEPHEVASAEMPAGSMLFWLGGTLHASGPNTTADDWRYGVILTYSAGWVRQEENQYLDTPTSVAANLSPELRDLIGYEMHGGLGFYDPGMGPRITGKTTL